MSNRGGQQRDRLDEMADLVRWHQAHLALALQNIDLERAVHDGWPSGGDGSGVTTSSVSSSTERAALALGTAKAERDRLIILDQFEVASRALHAMRRAAQAHIVIAEAKRCDRGTGRDGVLEWGDPLCVEFAAGDRGGLGLKCADAERKWRVARGLPAREHTERDDSGRFARRAS